MSIIVLLSLIHFFFFSFFELSFINLKTTIFSIQREKIISSLLRKQTKVSTNNFKIDIKAISESLEMCKTIISAQIVIYQPIRNLSHYVVRQEVEALHSSYPLVATRPIPCLQQTSSVLRRSPTRHNSADSVPTSNLVCIEEVAIRTAFSHME